MVQRYDCVMVEYDRAEMELDETGEWVKYEDYERLRKLAERMYQYIDTRAVEYDDTLLSMELAKEFYKSE